MMVVLDDLDVFAATGAAKTALWRTFTAQVNDGELTIVLTNLAVSTKDLAICAIKILSLQIPPTCSITTPTDGATFTAPVNITITADAADNDDDPGTRQTEGRQLKF